MIKAIFKATLATTAITSTLLFGMAIEKPEDHAAPERYSVSIETDEVCPVIDTRPATKTEPGIVYITRSCPDGNHIYSFYGDRHKVGEEVTVTFSNNGTPFDLTDDRIVGAK